MKKKSKRVGHGEKASDQEEESETQRKRDGSGGRELDLEVDNYILEDVGGNDNQIQSKRYGPKKETENKSKIVGREEEI